MKEPVKFKGYIIAEIRERNGNKATLSFHNQLLNSAKCYVANSAAGKYDKPIYISNMLFGDGGTENGQEREVDVNQGNLFGVVRVNKEVISQIDPEMPNQAIFTALLEESDGNGHILNEMALQLSNGELFSIATFPDLHKNDQMEIAWGWYICFI